MPKVFVSHFTIALLSFLMFVPFLQAQDWKTDRTVRYEPQGQDFVITNGQFKFNRALYGVNTAFRVEAGDLPEFALYMPGMGGNFKFALVSGDRAVWLTDAKKIEARYRPGCMIYNIFDPLLGDGNLRLTVLPMVDEEGLMLKIEGSKLPNNIILIAVYGGATNQIFRRDGERNVDAADCFFLKSANCKGNEYSIEKNSFTIKFGAKTAVPSGSHSVDKVPVGRTLVGTFPTVATLTIRDVSAASTALALLQKISEVKLPILCGVMELKTNKTLYFSLHNPQKRQAIDEKLIAKLFIEAEKARVQMTGRLIINTPDKYLNAVGGALSVAGDAIWQDPSYLHGAISWRVRIPGWRAAYTATALGWNDRAKTHFTAYANSQLTAPASGPVEMDTALSFGRVKRRIGNAMYSSGYICPLPNNPKLADLCFYDMNLVYIDGLLRHIYNTGDLTYAKQMWPTIERHLAWEKRTFDTDGDGLYDAFACIWASDALQYSGGGVTHSSAYNYFSNKCVAELATLIGKDATPYQQESEKILKAINAKLWFKDKGQYAEFVDALGLKKTHESAGLWTVYHSIDSKIADLFQQYQALRYVDTQIPHIPFNVKGLENENFHAVATTNWMPYYWSINNVTPAEQFHTALAYWQGGRNEEAYTLLKSMVMDNMFCGSSPGNFPMMSIYNAAAHGESYRDFADVIGIASRTIVEGLIGLQPDAVHGKMVIKPGLPAKWDFASFSLPYFDFDFKYSSQKSNYTITQKREKVLAVNLQILAKTDKIAGVKVNGKPAKYKVLTENVGAPMLEIGLPANAKNTVAIAWDGNAINTDPKEIKAAFSETKTIDAGAKILKLNDPQSIVAEQKINGSQLQLKLNGEGGERTLFAQLQQGEMTWWQPVHVTLTPAIEIVAGDSEDAKNLNMYLKNNSDNPISGTLTVGKNSGNPFVKNVTVQPHASSDLVQVSTEFVVAGTNNVEFNADNGLTYTEQLVNWTLPLRAGAKFENVNISAAFNDKVNNIFAFKKYLSPRSPYNTLQLPLQGMGDWCVPLRIVAVNDSGFRAVAKNDLFATPFGLSFSTPNAVEKPNIAFTSLFDNYPDSLSLSLTGKASHAYLLMAGSTNHMQSRMVNGLVTVKYTDGTESVLKLINPETWAPIERDYFTDDLSYKMNRPRPYRVILKTGKVARNLEKEIKGEALDARLIDGGGAIILDLPLDKNKELKSMTITSKANEVVIGLMGVTLETTN
jgi:hypothetical protein